ncbi:MAG: anti-sigma factor antagonist [Coriobacteriales bacterium]|nr:anti-sigma factor antagonist [Coriobacteriales bacterium]
MSYEHDIALVPISGDLNVQTAPAFKRTLDDLLHGGCQRIVLNMADVPFVDSAGMGAIFWALRQMRATGGLMSLINVSSPVMRALKIARIVDLVPVSTHGGQKEVQELDPAVQPIWRTSIPVDKRDLMMARARIGELANQMPFSRDEVFDLTLAAGEAIGNAVDHTGGSGVLATVSAYPDRMVIEVTDCGEGYRDDGTMQEADCDCERGRGIKLMHLLVDSVSIKCRKGPTGTIVRLVKLTTKD